MNRETDFPRFLKLMLELGSTTPQGVPSPEKVEGYFQLLEDMDFETIKQNAIYAIRSKGFFPMISEIRREGDAVKLAEAKADRAYRLIEFLMRKYYYPGFGPSCMAVIEDKLTKWGEMAVLPLLNRWGQEILENSNPSATRAQFLKSFMIETGEFYQLPEHKQREISDRATVSPDPTTESEAA
jgi:hypothetical protein